MVWDPHITGVGLLGKGTAVVGSVIMLEVANDDDGISIGVDEVNIGGADVAISDDEAGVSELVGVEIVNATGVDVGRPELVGRLAGDVSEADVAIGDDEVGIGELDGVEVVNVNGVDADWLELVGRLAGNVTRPEEELGDEDVSEGDNVLLVATLELDVPVRGGGDVVGRVVEISLMVDVKVLKVTQL